MGGDILLGLDIGTTGSKAALFDFRGRVLSSGESGHPLSCPRPGWAEQDARDWWGSARAAVRAALAGPAAEGGKGLGAHGAAGRIAAVAVSSQAPTLLALDTAGEPLAPALIWMDRRAEEDARALREELGAEFIQRESGNRADPFYVAAKIRWFRRKAPELFAVTRLFIQANGYVAWKLTDSYSMDPVHAALLQLRRRGTGEWSAGLCRACGVEPSLFPPVMPGHEVLGPVTGAAAEATGLREGTPVMVGTVDGAAAAVEAGAVTPGSAAEMSGTSTVLLMASDRLLSEPAFISMPHALPGLHLLLGAISTSGASLEWLRSRLAAGSYEDLMAEAAAALPGSGGVVFLPYMAGERSPLWDSDARGVFFGLSLASTRADMIRSVLEGTAFALRHNVEVARAAGLPVEGLRSVGGGTRSSLWNGIKADVLGLPVRIPRASCGAPFGDAVLAGMGLGLYPDPAAAVGGMVEDGALFTPDPARHRMYTERYGVFREVYERLKGTFARAAGSAVESPAAGS